MKALVISGGGSKGAFAGGILDYLTNVEGRDYDLYVASSTGVLVQLLGSTRNITKLKEAYTSVTDKDIWKVNPFKVKKNKNGVVKVNLNIGNIIWNMLPKFKFEKKNKFPWFFIKKIAGKISFGDSSNVLDLIHKFMSEKDYMTVKETMNKELVVCVVNATLKQVEYKSSKNWGYKDFCEWSYASTCAYPFMGVVNKNGFQYIDGGILESVPIQEAINRGATEIDVIVLKEENPKFDPEIIRNVLHGILNEIDMMHTELTKDDIQIGKLRAMDDDVTLNMYYTPRKLTNNSLVFDKEQMNKWWGEGYEYAKSKDFRCYKLQKGRKPRQLSLD